MRKALIIGAALAGLVVLAAGALLAWIAYAFELFPRGDHGDSLLRWVVVLGVPVLGGLLAGGLHLLLRRVIQQPVVLGIPAVIGSAFNDSTSSMPDSFGIMMSVTTRSGRRSLASYRPSATSSARRKSITSRSKLK